MSEPRKELFITKREGENLVLTIGVALSVPVVYSLQ